MQQDIKKVICKDLVAYQSWLNMPHLTTNSTCWEENTHYERLLTLLFFTLLMVAVLLRRYMPALLVILTTSL